MLRQFLHFAGIETHRVSHRERLASIFGAFLGIFLVFLSARYFLGSQSAILVVGSMGASAVLLFAIPHGALSQPWPLFGGQLLSAAIGITCAKLIPSALFAAPLAVACAVGVMHYLRCIHPPGGATAFAASLGTPDIHALGYDFLLTPVLLNVVIIFITAVSFNWFFSWRRYPAALARKPPTLNGAIPHENFVYALSQLDSFIDVTEQDLELIYRLATGKHVEKQQQQPRIEIGRCYSNGEYGGQWSVRRIESMTSEAGLVYRVVAGEGRNQSNAVRRDEFASWAKYEVVLDEGNWRRVGGEARRDAD